MRESNLQGGCTRTVIGVNLQSEVVGATVRGLQSLQSRSGAKLYQHGQSALFMGGAMDIPAAAAQYRAPTSAFTA